MITKGSYCHGKNDIKLSVHINLNLMESYSPHGRSYTFTSKGMAFF